VILLKTSDGSAGYDTTSNPGGEYKVWVSSSSDFENSLTKTDNFKVRVAPPPPPPTDWPLEGRKFYDLNGDGLRQDSEPTLEGWTINIYGDNPIVCLVELVDGACPEGQSVLDKNFTHTNGEYFTAATTTGTGGIFSFPHLTTGGTYGVCEAIPTGGTWMATTIRPLHSNGGTSWESQIFCPRHVQADAVQDALLNENACLVTSGTSTVGFPLGADLDGDGQDDEVNLDPGRGPVDFGNLCLTGVNGRTLGFWSNRNGQALFGADDLALMVALNLRNASGAHFNPGNYPAFRTWILSATATNMAYMLSAQLAAMELNVNNGFVTGGTLILAGDAPAGCSVTGLTGAGFISITDLMAAANASLGSDGLTVAAGPVRSCQEFMKNALDAGNNQGVIAIQTSPAACTGTANTACSDVDIQDVLDAVDVGIGPIPAPEP
jgi:hypothetical protein